MSDKDEKCQPMTLPEYNAVVRTRLARLKAVAESLAPGEILVYENADCEPARITAARINPEAGGIQERPGTLWPLTEHEGDNPPDVRHDDLTLARLDALFASFQICTYRPALEATQ